MRNAHDIPFHIITYRHYMINSATLSHGTGANRSYLSTPIEGYNRGPIEYRGIIELIGDCSHDYYTII